MNYLLVLNFFSGFLIVWASAYARTREATWPYAISFVTSGSIAIIGLITGQWAVAFLGVLAVGCALGILLRVLRGKPASA